MNELFATLIARLLATVPALRTVQRWNNQLANEGQERPANLAMPAAYLELLSARLTSIGPGIQHGEGVLRLRVCAKSLREAEASAYALENQVYLALQNFSGGPLLTGLDRRALYPDNNHGAVEMLVAEYNFKYQDTTAREARSLGTQARVVVTTGIDDRPLGVGITP